jgi:3-deoxy-D-manno-octulosonic-acid transferase
VSYAAYRALTNALWPLTAAASAIRAATGAPEWRERVGLLRSSPAGSLWLHAASVGEVAAVVPLARALATRATGVFLTTVTATGRAAASRSLPSVPVSFAPLDVVPAVRRVLAARRPRALLLTETELWPNTIHECAEAGVPVGMVNGRLSSHSLRRYSMAGSPMREIAPRLSFAACRSEADAAHYLELGLPESRVRVVGDTKFDKAAEPLPADEVGRLRESLGFGPDDEVVVFGSVRPREEGPVASSAASLLRLRPAARVVLAPRHLERVAPMRRELESRGVVTALRSDGPIGIARALVLDTTGELAAVYGVGSAAFVGGTLAPYGGHDPLEPAAQGVPVVMGGHTETCRETARRLLEAGGAIEVTDEAGLERALLHLLSDDEARRSASESALRAVSEGRGATLRTIAFLEELGVLDAEGR